MSIKRRIAIIGCGGMGSGHAYALGGKGGYTGDDGYSSYNPGQEDMGSLKDKLELAGIYDKDPARIEWARSNGFGVYGSFEEMLEDATVDIILIALPNHLHREYAIRALRAGKHVLCEKPVMLSSAELIEVMAVAKECGRVFYPRQNRRWDRDFLMACRLISDGTLGNVFAVESRVMGSRGIPGDWRAVKEYGGGMMLDWGVHLIDRMLIMIPEPVKKVWCRFTHVHYDEVDDGFTMQLIFESGRTAVIEVGTSHFIGKPLWYIAGANGTAKIDDWDCNGGVSVLKSWEDKDATPILAGEGLTKTMAPRGGSTVEELPLPDVTVDRDALYENLVDTINGEAEQIVTPEQALRVLRLMEAAVLSDEKGIAVDFE